MKKRPTIRVVLHRGGHSAQVSGHGSYDLLRELRRRSPVWSSISRAWMTQQTTARDLVALAESRGFDVVVSAEEKAA